MLKINTDVHCINKKTGDEIFGVIDRHIYDDNKNLIGYEITNCCNHYDLCVEDFISLKEWIIDQD